jgi:hypothetical protein
MLPLPFCRDINGRIRQQFYQEQVFFLKKEIINKKAPFQGRQSG